MLSTKDGERMRLAKSEARQLGRRRNRAERSSISAVSKTVRTGDRCRSSGTCDAEIDPDGSIKHLPRFEARDELKEVGNKQPPYFAGACGDEIRQRLRSAATLLPWAGFRQSFDLAVFGQLDRRLWDFAGALVGGGLARQRVHEPPRTLQEWEPFLTFTVSCYAAYFEAFYPPGERPVGGGVDVVSLPWPD